MANLWSIACSKLSKEQQEILKSGLVLPVRFDDLRSTVDKTRKDAESHRWKIKTRNGTIVLREHFNKMVSWIQKFIAVGDTVVTYDPGHAALPWAAVRFILQVMVNDTTRAAEFVKGLEEVSFYIYDSAVRENLYLTKGTIEERTHLESHIVDLYMVILKFLLEAKMFFDASSGRRIMSSVLKTGEDVVQLLHPAVQLANQIVTISGRIDAEILVSMSNVVQNLSDSNATSMATLREWLGNNNATLNLINSNQKETIARIDSLKDSLEGKVQKDHRLKVLEWLSSIPYERHHKKALDEVLHGTGLWFLEDEEYRHWRDSDQNAVLWVHGIPGSGKSKLVSLAIQQALDSSDDTSSSLYFYCSRTSAEPERAKAEDIVRCLVKQLSTGKDSNQPTVIPPYVNEKFEESEARGFASGELMFDESCDLISKFATDKDRTFILFDAFDECEEDARYSLIEALNALMQRISTSLVKILISSRDDLHLKTFFDNHLTYENHIETRNQQDIDLYVKSQLKQLIKQKRIVVGGKAPSPSLQDFIITKLCAGSQGMFRWVSLQLDYLATLHTVSDVRHRLGRLPEHLSGSYDELYNRTLNRYEPEERKCLEIALSLLLVPLRPPPHVFSQFVLWNEDDEDSDDDSNYDDDDDNDDNDDNDDDSGDGNSDGDGDDDEDNDNANEEDDVDSTSAISDLSTSEERDGLWSQRAAARYSDGVTRLCFGLVIFDKTTHSFRLAHTSVQDYLLNQRSEYQTVCVNYARLAERCIFILLQTCTVSSIYPKYHEDERKIVTTASGQSLENSDKFGPRDEPSFFDGPSYDSKDWLVSIFWVEEHWAYYTAKSERHRQSSPLMQLETQLRDLVIQQPWESVRPMMFFSACRDGLRDLVEKWARAHPQLTRTALRHPRGTTALLETCCGDDSWPDIVEMLITLGADFGYVNEEGETPLYGALIRNHEAVVSLLLKNGPSLANCQLRLGLSGAKDVFSPLHVTIRKHRDKALPVAKVLLDYGADVNATDSMGLGALHPVKLMSVELLELLLDNGADIDTKTPDNRTPLMLAVLGNKLELCKKLVARGADLSTKDLNGWTALGIAAHNGQENLARLLIESGIDVNSRQQKYGATALHLAAREGHIGVAKLLMESKIEISAVTEDGWTALHLATWEGHEKLAKSLIASGLGINGRASMGRTALHLAAEQGHNNIVKALISSKIDISAVDDNGYTAVHVAALGGHTKLVKLLIASGLDIDRRSNLGRTALHLAAERGDDNMANALIGSNVFVDARDTSAQTALHLAAFGANESTVSLLLASGAEPNLFSHSGQTPLFKAALHESVETMERLLPDTTNINTQDCDGDTPLSMAASQGHLANVQLLLDNGAEIVPQEPGPYCGFLDPEERVEGYGRDALLTAWLDGHEDVVRTILESAIEREPESEYSIALRLLTEKETGAFGTWMEARRANATENREDIESFRKEIEERADALIEENRRKIALELGVEPYQEHV